MITTEQFNQRVKAGEKLVLLDDMVLDMGDYINKHPGGRFSMEANIGRDVSKYFYGGYSLENFGPKRVMPHTHSNDARRLVDKFAIGYLNSVAHRNRFQIQETKPANGNGTTQTIVFKSDTPIESEIIQNSLLNPLQIAKHYVVKSTALP